MSNCPQSNVKVRKRLKTWQQQTTCKHQQNSNSVWGWIKFHNSFGKLIDDESLQLQQKILKVFVRKNIVYRDLLLIVKNLLNAPINLVHGYALFLRHDPCFKNDELFAGEFLNNKNVSRLKNSFLIDLMPSPIYYSHKVVVDYLKNNEDTMAAKQIFSILNHPTFLFHLKREFGFREMLLFLLNWLPRAGESWPWHKWELNRLFNWTSEYDWAEVDNAETAHELILMHVYNQINTSKDVLFDFCLRLLNLFIRKCPILGHKFLKMVDSKFIADQLPKASNYSSLISLFLALHKSAGDEQKHEIEEALNLPVFVEFLVDAVQFDKIRPNVRLRSQLLQIQQIRFCEIRDLLNTFISYEDSTDLNELIQEKYPAEAVDDLNAELISTTPPGYYLYEAIYSAINGSVDSQLLTILENVQVSVRDFIRMCISVLTSVFESISSKERLFEPEYYPILICENNPLAWIYKEGCLLFKDIWLSGRMQSIETNLRFYKTSQIVNELLCEVMETRPITLSDWTSKLHQSFMLKWLCNKAEEVDEEQNQEWEKLIRETMLPNMKEIVRKKYVGYLQQGFVFKKYIKNSEHRVESYVRRKWVLDSSEIAFRVFDCDRPDKQRAKNDENEAENEVPELILAVKSIIRIIQAEEYLEKSKALWPTKKRIFRKGKSPKAKIPNGLFVETISGDEHEILYENEEEFHKFTRAFDILRFEKYPTSEVEKLLAFEVQMRMLNLNSADTSDDQSDPKTIPHLPIQLNIINSFARA